MTQIDRRRLLALGAASLALPAAIQKAWAIDAKSATGTIKDVKHVVILMQENRSFDHYFGTMNGVRGFGDRFPIPLPGGKTVWSQNYTKGEPAVIMPFPLNTTQTFAHMRVEGTPHNWADAQYAWDNGRMSHWPDHKLPHAMGHYMESDIPFQWALADAFTLCEAYHCSFQGGTNTNRLFHWTGTNDGAGKAGGPSISNSHDTLPEKAPKAKEPYTWTTYPERLEAAGVSWKIYEDMVDNFGDNPLVGFKAFRDSIGKVEGSNPALAAKGHATQHLDVLRADVMAGTLPSVSWVIAPSKDSEHPGPSSPAQGADYIARVLDALTSNPDTWAQTVFLINYDENDGFFDHMPPPAPPSKGADGKLLGATNVDAEAEYHLVPSPADPSAERPDLMGRPYGVGPRVPLFVISPWSRGGWVNAEVFDHTSIIRFCEKRFGVMEPNISPWRRAVCGDLTSCFDFKTPNEKIAILPDTRDVAQRAAALPGRTKPPTPVTQEIPEQRLGRRRMRPLGYSFSVEDLGTPAKIRLRFRNHGEIGVVFHVYDHKRPEQAPRRYTVGASSSLSDEWPTGGHDLSVYGPNGYYRRYTGLSSNKETMAISINASAGSDGRSPSLDIYASTAVEIGEKLTVEPVVYGRILKSAKMTIRTTGEGIPPEAHSLSLPLTATGGWYDYVLRRSGERGWRVRAAGYAETGQPGMTDPALGGPAVMDWG